MTRSLDNFAYLDEPTASLDVADRETFMGMIHEARHAGSAIVAIFHDDAICAAVCSRSIDM